MKGFKRPRCEPEASRPGEFAGDPGGEQDGSGRLATGGDTSTGSRTLPCAPGTHKLQLLPRFLLDSFVEGIHYVVDYDGLVIKVADELFRANHAGTSVWEQKVGAKHVSVGIETWWAARTETP